MNGQKTVTALYRVFEGEHVVGRIRRKETGRHSDALVIFLNGEADYFFDGFSFSVHDGGVFYLAKGAIYEIVIHKPSQYICIDFDFSEQDEKERSELLRDLPAAIKQDFERIFVTYMKKSPHSRAHAMSLLYRIYTEIIRAQSKRYARVDRLFSEATAFVLSRYTDTSLSVRGIAQAVGVSEVHLRRVFRDAVGMSPIQYISFVRIEKAKAMLSYSDAPISEIAAAVGFEDPYYFSRLFRAQVGASPTEYRSAKA